ncbi:MAG: sulfatase-like hydrolase/transferase [Verrucomicrobiales bacterium]
MGAFGSQVPDATPNIDRLAASGMKFARAHVTIAVCQPCRNVLMTGAIRIAMAAFDFSTSPIRRC